MRGPFPEVMRQMIKIGISAFLFALGALGLVQSTHAQQHSSPQTQFSAEDSGVKAPVPIPADVIDILRNDDGVRTVLESENISSANIPNGWFSASSIQLGSNTDDLVVIGERPLAGSNVVPFWIFYRTPRGYKLVLAAYAQDLIVRKKRFKGYREIKLISMTASVVSTVQLRFDGSKYVTYKSKSEPIH